MFKKEVIEMVEVKELIKLHSRKRYYKLLREGLKFIADNWTSPLIIKNNTRRGEGEIFLSQIGMDYEIYFNGKYIVQYEVRRSNKGIRELGNRVLCLVEEYNFNMRLDKYTIQQIAENIGDLVLLFVPDDEITIAMILGCHNQTIMSTLINKYDEKKFFAKLPHNLLHKDGETELLELNVGGRGIRMRMVKVVDANAKQTYLLRVPPTVRTCKEAVAWTFGMKADEYGPKVEA